MIRLEHVTKVYDVKPAVDDLSLHVDKGEVCILIGPSGCGKTTTLRLINRLVDPTSGKIWVNDEDTSTVKPEILRRSIGYAIQSVGLFPHMNVSENIAVVPGLLGWEKTRTSRRTEELLDLVGLDPGVYSQKYPAQLSGGEAQRFGVARALAADPPVLLMDEPFGAVDPLTRQRLQGWFIRLQQRLKKTIILVTHDLDEAIRLADKIAIMQAGKLVQYDVPETILSRPANMFVHDFVGVDRALKRLSRVGVKRYVRQAPTVTQQSSKEDVLSAIEHRRSVWVLDEGRHPVGWIDRANMSNEFSIKDITFYADQYEMSVTTSDTLRDALSKMLGLGFRSIPVVDENGRFAGELTLADIEAATSEMENSSHG